MANEKLYVGVISISIVIMLSALFFRGQAMFFFLIGLGIIIIAAPFVFSAVRESALESEKEEIFVEFTRNLVESVKTGIPISRSIINVKDKPYGVLSKHITKLANQIYIGIPLVKALQNFARDVNNKTISRAITLIGQAEKSGGDIGEILESVADAVSTSDKLTKERKAVISTLVVQGYIIFFIFIIIILVLQFKLIPMIFEIGVISNPEETANIVSVAEQVDKLAISHAFLYLLLIQGFFSGLAIGKLAERSAKAGLKHSFILVVSAFLISSGANVIFGT